MAKKRDSNRAASRRQRPTQSGTKSNSGVSVGTDAELADERLVAWLQRGTGFLFAALLVWAFLVPVDATSVFLGQGLPQQLFWLATACTAAACAWTNGGFPFRWLDWIGVGLGISGLLLVTWLAGEETNPRRGWHGFWQVVAIAACYFSARGLAVGPRTRATLMGVVLAGCCASAIHGLYQVSVTFPAVREQYRQDPDAVIAGIPGLEAPEGSPQRQRFEDRVINSYEPYSQYALANSLAVTLSAGLFVLGAALVYLGVYRRKWWQQNKLATVAVPMMGGLVLVAWFLTKSRTAWLAVILGVVLSAVLAWTRRKRLSIRLVGGIAVTGGLLLTVAIVLLYQNDSLVITEAEKSLGYRVQYWQSTLAMIQDHPWTGVGIGNFQSYYPQYKLAVASEEIADPHNLLLDVAATLGVPLLILSLFWLGQVFVGAVRQDRDESTSNKVISSTESGVIVGEAGLGQMSDLREQWVRQDERISRSLEWGLVLGGTLTLGLLALLLNVDGVVALLCWVPAVLLMFALKPLLVDFIAAHHWTVAVSALVMILCLMASGSWQASGIAMPLMVLLAIGDRTNCIARRKAGVGAVLLPVLGLVCFVFQSWLPVTKAWSLTQQAQFASSPREQFALTAEAAEQDPLDAELQSWVAQAQVLEAQNATRASFGKAARDAGKALDAWLERDGVSFTNWLQAGRQVFQLSARAEQYSDEPLSGELDRLALRYFEKAVDRYPNSVDLRVQASAAAFRVQKWDRFEELLESAVKLSEMTPHEDKKLGRHRVSSTGDQMVSYPFAEFRESAENVPRQADLVPAELLIEWMRRTRTEAVQ